MDMPPTSATKLMINGIHGTSPHHQHAARNPATRSGKELSLEEDQTRTYRYLPAIWVKLPRTLSDMH